MNEMIMVCHSLINNTGTSLTVSFLSNTNPLSSQITSNFRHLLSCGTIVAAFLNCLPLIGIEAKISVLLK